jgi:hypothetical protein
MSHTHPSESYIQLFWINYLNLELRIMAQNKTSIEEGTEDSQWILATVNNLTRGTDNLYDVT